MRILPPGMSGGEYLMPAGLPGYIATALIHRDAIHRAIGA